MGGSESDGISSAPSKSRPACLLTVSGRVSISMTSLALETVLDFGGTRGGLEDVNDTLGDVLDAPEVLPVDEPKKLDAGMDWLPLVLAKRPSNQLWLLFSHIVDDLRGLEA